MRPLRRPNLPAGRVLHCVAGAGEYAGALRALGICVLSPAPSRTLPAEEREHADMLMCHAAGNAVFIDPGQTQLRRELETLGFDVTAGGETQPVYPKNIAYNVACSGAWALGNMKHIEPRLGLFFRSAGIPVIGVRQGYAKCSVCFVRGNAVITEDAGIAAALERIGADVLRVSAGDVYLSEAHHGFFGGASGLIAPDRLAVTGSLSSHRDGERIKAFLHRYGVSPVELTDGRIRDIGGVLPLTEDFDTEETFTEEISL